MIVVFSGPPCSGKSLLGGLVAPSRSFTHLEMDAIRLRLLPGASHTREDRQIAYRAMHFMAETLALRGESIIVNAGYSHAADRRDIEEVASRAQTSLYLIEFTVAPKVAVQRSSERKVSHPGLDLTDERVADLARGFPFFLGGLVIDSEGPPDGNLRRILDYLSYGQPLSPGPWSAAGIP